MQGVRLALVYFLLLVSTGAQALTEADCKSRVNNAMHNSDKLGGNDTDAYRWAQIAASECFKEISQNGGGNSINADSSSNRTGSLLFGFLLLLIGGYFVLRPRLATESEARAAFKKIARSLTVNPEDHPRLVRFKKSQLVGLDEGLAHMLGEIRQKNKSYTQYFVRSLARDAVSKIRKAEEEVKKTGNIKPVIDIIFCTKKECREGNFPTASVCHACGANLPTLAQLAVESEKYEERQDIEETFLEEQVRSLKAGLEEFGLLIEARARVAGEEFLAMVCEAYFSGNLQDRPPRGFGWSDRDQIYVRSSSEERSAVIRFPINEEKAKQIAVEAIRSLVNQEAGAGGDEHKANRGSIIEDWARIFLEDKESADTKSPLYAQILTNDRDLFLKAQSLIARSSIDWYINFEENHGSPPPWAASDFIRKAVPLPEMLSQNFIDECANLDKEANSRKLGSSHSESA